MNTALRYGKTSLTWGVLVSTIAWTMGLAALLTPFTTAQAVASGDLIKASQAAVYYYGEDGKRYVFPNEKTYWTWYSDFSGVITITDAELAAIAIGGNVTYKPGVKMVKITTDPKVYVVDANGMLRPIADEAEAVTLYGADWNTMIDDVPDAFFTNYTVGSAATGFDKAAAEAAATSINDDKSLTTTSGPPTGGSITVSLAADTPATGTIPGGAARVPFTKVNFTNTTALDAVVDQVIIERMGLAVDANFTDVDLLGPDMLPLNQFSKTFGSEHTATINDNWTVPANSTMGVYLAGNMAASQSTRAGELPILAIRSVTLQGGGTVSGVLPIAGNHFVINGTISIGTATIVAGGNNPAAATKEIGTQNYIVSSFKITAGAAEDLDIGRVTFTNNGSASPEDVENLELVNSNTSEVVDTKVTVSADKFAMDINQPLDKGKNVTFDLRLDIKNGSARTISYDIDQRADLEVTGKLFGYKILPTYTGVSATPYFNANNTTIGDGTLQIESVAVNPTNIAEGLDSTVLGKIKMIAKGEAMNITSMGWSFDIVNQSGSIASSTDITNVTVLDDGGSVVAGPIDLVDGHGVGNGTSNGSATTTDTITVPNGETTYTVRGDLSTDFTADDTIQLRVFPGNITVKGDISGNTVTATPSSGVAGTTLTVRAAALDVTNSSLPAAQTIVAGAQQFNVANFNLDASSSGDDIRVTSIAIGHKHTGNSFPNMLSGWKISIDGVNVPINSESVTCSGATCNTTGTTQATTTLTLTTGVLKVTAGSSDTLKVTANVGTGATSGTFAVYCGDGGCITAIDSDAQTVTNTYQNDDGQVMTIAGGGTLNVAVLTSDPKSNVAVGGAKVEVGRFTLEPKNEGATLNKFGIHIDSPDGGLVGDQDEVNTLELCQVGGSCYGPITVTNSRATISPSGLSQLQNQEKTYVLNVVFNAINDNSPAQAGAGIRLLLGNIDVTGTSVGSTSVTVSGLGTQFNTFTVFKSIPTVGKIAFAGGDIITGNNTELDLYKLSVKADAAGPIGLWKMTFGVSTTTVDLKTDGYTLYESDTASSLGDIISTGGDIAQSQGIAGNNQHYLAVYLDINNDDGVLVGEHRVIGAGVTKYYTLRGTTRADHDGTADNESIATVLAGDASFASTTASNAHEIDRRYNDNVADAVDGGLEEEDLQDDFIWSDLNFDLYTTTTATRTQGWFNGYRVPGLDNTSSTSQTITD